MSFQIGRAAKCFLWAVVFGMTYYSYLFASEVSPPSTESQNLLVSITDITRIPVIDGVPNDEVWETLSSHRNFIVVRPDTLELPLLSTETKMFYNNEGIYVAFWCEQSENSLVSRLSSRDSNIVRDSFIIGVDVSGEGKYGYLAELHLGGSKSDSSLLPEKYRNEQWNGAWIGATSIYEDGWAGELFLPWSMMSMPKWKDVGNIGIYQARTVGHLNETWSWPALPDTKPLFISEFQDVPITPVNSHKELTLFPFFTTNINRANGNTESELGIDINWRPQSSLLVGASLNPDFAQVESDDIVVNLSAFETYFPEKRPFFLEGQEIFVTSPRAEIPRGDRSVRFTAQPTTLLNTRRIGSSPELGNIYSSIEFSDDDVNALKEIVGAAKIVGQAGKIRYGAMLVQEDNLALTGKRGLDKVELEVPGTQYTVGRLIYEDVDAKGRFSIGWMVTNAEDSFRSSLVNGIDLHRQTNNGALKTDIQFVHSKVNGLSGLGMYSSVNIVPKQGVIHRLSLDYVDRDLDISDMGFIRRNDYRSLKYEYHKTRSNLDYLISRRDSFSTLHERNFAGEIVRRYFFGRRSWNFLDRSSASFEAIYFPSRSEDRASLGNGSFTVGRRISSDFNWNSDRSLPLSLAFGLAYQSEDIDGHRILADSSASWRPNERMYVTASVAYQDRNGWLVHQGERDFTAFNASDVQPRLYIDYFRSANHQLSINLQWVRVDAVANTHYQISENSTALSETTKTTNHADNFRINRLAFQLRYRWEIAPLSELYLVYNRAGFSEARSESDSSLWADFRTAINAKDVDLWSIKLRYRF